MKFENFFTDERAVSPVIGVILMVAITVILAAVIGTFVLGLSDQVGDTTPQASFDIERGSQNASNAYNVTVTHETGDTIDGADLNVSVNGTSATWGGEVSAGSSFIVGNNESALAGNADLETWVASGDTVRVIYHNPNSDSSSTLAKKEIN